MRRAAGVRVAAGVGQVQCERRSGATAGHTAVAADVAALAASRLDWRGHPANHLPDPASLVGRADAVPHAQLAAPLRDGAVAAGHPLRVRAVGQQRRAVAGRHVQQEKAARLVAVQNVRPALVELLGHAPCLRGAALGLADASRPAVGPPAPGSSRASLGRSALTSRRRGGSPASRCARHARRSPARDRRCRRRRLWRRPRTPR